VVADDAVIYAASGYGLDLDAPDEGQDLLLGGGVELAVTPQITVEAQYLHGFPLDGVEPTDQLTFGANFHF
jgi:outer membrane immunogenic protein